MEFFEAIKKRRSVRAFEEKKIEEEKLQKILEAANLAPSAGNLQAYEIFVVKDAAKKKSLGQAALCQDFVEEAPVVLVFCASPKKSSIRYGKRGEELYCVQDATIAASYAQLAATALELATCWVGAISEDEVLKILENPKRLKPVCILPVGYPAEEPQATERTNLSDLAHEV